ncbi:MAG: PrsW family glutamic-type intramembrane protease [Bdellovibrionota bacterium]
MSITITCSCGKELFADTSMSGSACKCPACGAPIEIPFVEPEPPPPPPEPELPLLEEVDTAPPAPSEENIPAPPVVPTQIHAPPPLGRFENIQELLRTTKIFYAICLVVFLPLAWHVLVAPKGDSIEKRLGRTVEQLRPQDRGQYASSGQSVFANLDTIINSLPNHRLTGAFLPRDTKVHYVFGISAGLLFFGFLIFLSFEEEVSPLHLLGAGFLTGTLGVIYLMVVQAVAIGSLAVGISTSIVGIVAKIIGFSYMAAFDPRNGFLLSLFGFTFGVGFCEEVCKVVPLLICFYDSPKWKLGWRTAMVWGMASGVGFGVAEGLIYAGQYYNGIMPGEVYFVRFLTCVGLHSVWAGSSGIAIFRNRKPLFIDHHEPLRIASTLVPLLAVPTFLHGLYDTVLKKEFDFATLPVALAALAWLVYQMSLAEKLERGPIAEDEEKQVGWS